MLVCDDTKTSRSGIIVSSRIFPESSNRFFTNTVSKQKITVVNVLAAEKEQFGSMEMIDRLRR